MKIKCSPSSERKSLLTITIDGEPWRHIHPSIFGYRPSLPKECHSIEDFTALFAKLELRQAKQYAIKRLSTMHMPSTTLVRSLKQRLVSNQVISEIIAELTSLGYLNDQEWIASFIRVQSAKKIGPKAIAQKLACKGLPSHQIERLLRESQSTQDQKASIAHLLATRYRTRNLEDFRERKKVVASLVRRGFDLSDVLALVNNGDDF